jgi:hypothetical protein
MNTVADHTFSNPKTKKKTLRELKISPVTDFTPRGRN